MGRIASQITSFGRKQCQLSAEVEGRTKELCLLVGLRQHELPSKVRCHPPLIA